MGRDDSIVFGSFEYASIPPLGIKSKVAKIDTGAYSGAIHCSSIELYERESDGAQVLRFVPSDNGQVVETEDYFTTYVRSSTGHRVRRYLIDTQIEIHGKTYDIRIGLSNRKNMQREILIGRRFLRENGILVDVRMGQELDNDGEGEKYEDSDSL